MYPTGDRFAEVLYYFKANILGSERALAMVSMYSPPLLKFLEDSFNTLIVCRKLSTGNLQVVEVQEIGAVVAMPPLLLSQEEASDGQYANLYYVAEKPGFEVFQLGEGGSDLDDENEPVLDNNT